MTALKILSPKLITGIRREPFDDKTLAIAASIVEEVKTRGEEAVLAFAKKFGEIADGGKLYYTKDELKSAFDELDETTKGLLERSAKRIEFFAKAQKNALSDIDVKIEGGRAGHKVMPVETAGCYAPGGRFPLPSSALMTALVAKTAGVNRAWVASPKPAKATLAAAYISGAEGLLAAGGAHAIAALAYGCGPVPQCDVVVGPGSRWVTAAKKVISGFASIDMLAGPSEVVVLADETADPAIVAADLLAQAEHDSDALPILVTLDAGLVDKVNAELEAQLSELPTAQTAVTAVESGFAVTVSSLEEAAELCDKLVPEHLQLSIKDAELKVGLFSNYGALFVGERSAEVFGDYCAGPNHTLPTGGTAKSVAGLSVFNFLRARTFLTLDSSPEAAELARDAKLFGEIEGLTAHSRAAAKRIK